MTTPERKKRYKQRKERRRLQERKEGNMEDVEMRRKDGVRMKGDGGRWRR